MTDRMKWLYDHYIQPQIESQPMDDEEAFHSSLLNPALVAEQRQDLACICRFYAVQGFQLGLKTGMALQKELGPWEKSG